jgi:DNA polymerase I-like protein with 3'-5' exonuclease and polymerase domains
MHDEIIIEAKAEIAKPVALILKDTMEGGWKEFSEDRPGRG